MRLILKATLLGFGVWALIGGPLSPILEGVPLLEQHAFAKGGNGNGNGGGNGNGQGRGGGHAHGQDRDHSGLSSASASSNRGLSKKRGVSSSEAAHDKNAEKKSLHEAIKGLAEVLGGRVNALHSLNSGKTSNAASHSAAGLASSFADTINDIFGMDDAEISDEDEEATDEEAVTSLGLLSNRKTSIQDEEVGIEESGPLTSAISAFAEALTGNTVDDDDENSFGIAEDTQDTVNSKESIGLGDAKSDFPGDDDVGGGG